LKIQGCFTVADQACACLLLDGNTAMKPVLLLALMVGVTVTGNAAAQYYGDGYRNVRNADYDYARVVRVDPIIVNDYPRHEEPRCYERGYNTYSGRGDDYYHAGHPVERGLATVVGGVAGAVLGSRVGGGNGRLVGTAVGTMVGGAAGRSIYDANNHGYEHGTERVCEPVSYHEQRERVDGYDVTYEYAGRQYHTRSDYNPGDRIRVRVDVVPY
jgi:uncharacterized protein YcfJ